MNPPQVTSAQLRWSGSTDRGKVRPNNEDAFLAMRFDGTEVHRLRKTGEASTAKTDFAFAVSDGMGGALAGEYASRIAIEKITTMLPRSFKQSATGFATDYDDVLTELFGEVHKALVYLGGSYEECDGMEATLTLCWFTPGWMHFGHIGDSRLYYLPANADKIKQLTLDDTHVHWLFRNGKINEREARTHPRRSVLQKALGGGNQFVDPQLGAVGYESGDIFLLCTDGLVDGLYDNHVVEILRDPESRPPTTDPAHRLVKEAVGKRGRDNTTALIIEVV
jgi:PPM family protein phosphatase